MLDRDDDLLARNQRIIFAFIMKDSLIATTLCLFALVIAAVDTNAEVSPTVPGVRHIDAKASDRIAGRILLTELGCLACHRGSDRTQLPGVRRGPVLDGIRHRVHANWIRSFLNDPSSIAHGTTMPDVLSRLPAERKQQAIDELIAYLGTDEKLTGQLVRMPTWSNSGRGRDLFHRVGCAACHGGEGTDLRRALDGLERKYSHQSLTDFLVDPLKVRPSGRMPHMQLSVQDASDIAAYLVKAASDPENRGRPGVQYPKSTDGVSAGRAWFETLGCAACHQKHGAVSKLKAPDLESLRSKSGGCLSKGDDLTPRFRPASEQVRALHAAISDDQPFELDDRMELNLRTFNCYACHDRNGIGGVGTSEGQHFSGNDSIGRDGRIPPTLTGVGRKLKTAWIARVLRGDGRMRPYIDTRMPVFGESNVGHLSQMFADADHAEPSKSVAGEIDAGRKLMGTVGGVGCITCHQFKGRKSLGIQAINLANATERLRFDWFRSYLIDPLKFRPGTLMPSFWPGGVATNQTVLGGDTDMQIASIWKYLETGSPLPDGYPNIDSREFELVPTDRPLMLRTFLKGVGPHAITVGFPQGVNFAFDDRSATLALAWRGRYIDAYSTWFVRRIPAVSPLGTDSVQFLKTVPFATDDDGKVSDIKAQFLGYRLDADGIPTFLYRIGDTGVEDRIVPTPKGSGLSRTFQLKGSQPGLWFRPSQVKGLSLSVIEPQRVVFKDDAATIRLEYRWSER